MRRRTPADGAATPRTSARVAALRLLGRRDYTAQELREKLAARGHPSEDIDRTLQALAAEGLQSDERAAAASVRSATRGRGRHRIGRELEARGVARDLVRRLVAGIAPEDEAAAIAAILARKRWPAAPTRDDRRRMFQHLLRRGFPADAIHRALNVRDEE
jgi:regulatory protein